MPTSTRKINLTTKLQMPDIYWDYWPPQTIFYVFISGFQ